jgi:hypothetical protein
MFYKIADEVVKEQDCARVKRSGLGKRGVILVGGGRDR